MNNTAELRAELERIGQEIQRLRKEAGLSQQAVAHEVGLSQGGVSRIETMQHAPGLTLLVRVLDAAGLRIEIVRKE